MRRILIALLALTGCTLGPDYVRPPIDMPQAFRFADPKAREVANTAWWEQFKDPALNELIRVALAENKDLRIAAARVEEFYGRLATTRAGLFPQIGVGAWASGQRNISPQQQGSILQTPGADGQTYTVAEGIGASWEIDLFGRIRRLTEAARAELLASEEARRAVVLSLVGAVATGYVNLRDLDKQLNIARSTLTARTETLKLFEVRFKGGTVSEVELVQARSEYESAKATLPTIEAAIASQENALAVLLGRNPGPVARGKPLDDLALPAVPAGLPSDLLERRPDIREAEQALVAANASIGAAQALYFPTITLTGLFGGVSTALGGMWTGPDQIWSYAGQVTVPIFTAGKIAGQVQQAEAQREQALTGYQQAIQTAFREVADGLIGSQKARERVEAQRRQVEALRAYARLARLRYDGGYTSYLEVLDADRSLFSADLAYTQTQGAVFHQLIGLYKAMGGGWVTEADKLTSPGAVAQGEAASEAPAAASEPRTQ